MQSVPIASLNGDHIFTIELEGILQFAEANPKDRKKLGFSTYDVAPDVQRIKLTAFAGFAEDLLTGQHTATNGIKLRPMAVLAFHRAQCRVPFYLGLYMQYGLSLQTYRRGTAYELMVGCFTRGNEAGDYIFTHANV